jgi:hypothetical protein
MSDDEQDNYYRRIEAIVHQLAAQRGELLHRRLRLRQADDLEKSLPADVPLHKRGFGVMDEPEGFA